MDVDEVLGDPKSSSVPTKSAIYVWGYNYSGRGERARSGCQSSSLRSYSDVRPHGDSTWHAAGRTLPLSPPTGANDFGQLGDGTEEGRNFPKKLKLLKTEYVNSVYCGDQCTAAIAEPRLNDGTLSTGRLWIWVQNQGSDACRLFWAAFAPNTVIRQVSCGSVHAAALSEQGLLQTWGYNECDQLGRGFSCEGLRGAQVIKAYTKFLDKSPELVKIPGLMRGVPFSRYIR